MIKSILGSPEVGAAAAEDDPVNFELLISGSDHGVTQRRLQEQLLKHVSAAHVPHAAPEVFKLQLK